MGLHWATLPTDAAGNRIWFGYGSTTGAGHVTGTAPNPAGIEDKRFARLDQARHRFEARNTDRSLAELAELGDFIISRWGAAHSFLVRDLTDYTTADDGVTAPSFGDATTIEQIGTGDGTRRQWQLTKTYSSGAIRHLRAIEPGSVVVKVNGVSVTEGTDYVVDHTMGTVLFASAPTNTHTVEAGCKFYNIVRFGEDVDGGFVVSLDNDTTGSAGVTMLEDGVVQHTGSARAGLTLPIYSAGERMFPGGFTDRSGVGGTLDVTFASGAVQLFDALTSTVTVKLPDVDGGGSSGHTDIAPFSSGGCVAGFYFQVINEDGTYNVNLQRWTGSAWSNLDPTYQVAPGARREVFLDGAGIWRAR